MSDVTEVPGLDVDRVQYLADTIRDDYRAP